MDAETRWADVGIETETGLTAARESPWTRLFAAIANGARDGLADLYDLAAAEVYGLALWRTGSPDDASDVVQETFLRVAQRCDRLAEVRRPRVWLLTVAHRVAIDLVRRRRPMDGLDDAVMLQAAVQDPARLAEARRASEGVSTLPPAQRAAVYLHVFADLSFAEAARVMGVPKFTAASRYRLAIAKLRRLMETEP